ncbi:hypothetical protein D6D19_04611 [Aureobasidium pullulans]|uniref:Uncharacterized protein n=1 Tax=Aureobasidium pullulans TaxID=5580 RepID=A0A4S9A6I9_AURPU|nr:hypothetical protein D6D19_04611 [Aureobasidium pullulans]
MMSGHLIEMNASPWLWIETTWVIIFSALDLALRIIVRSHEYGFEDTLLVLAFIRISPTRLTLSYIAKVLVLISAYFLVASKRYTTQNNPSDIIYGTALYWQIALVGHSVLATAIQPLKRAATSFSTHSNMLVGNTSQGSMSGKSSKLRSSNKTRRSLLLTETPPTPLSIIWSSAQAGDRLQDSDSIESHGSQDHIIVKKTDVQVTYSDDGRY